MHQFNIRYGTKQKNIDITSMCSQLMQDYMLYIPDNDWIRASIFGDPTPKTKKTNYDLS